MSLGSHAVAAALGAALFGAGVYLGTKLTSRELITKLALRQEGPPALHAKESAPLSTPLSPSSPSKPIQQASFQQQKDVVRVAPPGSNPIPAVISDLTPKFDLEWDVNTVCTWLSDIGCSPDTVSYFLMKNMNGSGLYEFIEPDKYGFRVQDKLAWFGVKSRDDIELIAQQMKLFPTTPS